MTRDKYRLQFAAALAEAFRHAYPAVYAAVGDEQAFSSDFLYDQIEKPKDPRMGRFALPVFKFARLFKEKPPDIAGRVITALENGGTNLKAVRIEAAGGFLNARIDATAQAAEVVAGVLSEGSFYGRSNVGDGKTELVEYSSVNIAKPFGIGHLRTTILGNSLRRIFQKRGFRVVGLNYLGDWGTQFGKMIVAYRLWGADLDLSENAVEKLVRLYIRFHEEAEENPSLDDEARKAFRDLEAGEPHAVELWTRFKDLSIAEFKRVYAILGVEFDLITGESFLNDKMEALIERLTRAGLTSTSRGALVVDLHDEQLPPLLLKKADGATLYATRDLAGAVWRWDEFRFEECLYVVATQQADHFKQVFKVIAMLEEAENVPDSDRFAHRLNHVDFGWVKFGDKTMSTRSGNIIFLEDVIDKAVALARQKILEKNPELKAVDETALMIGTGAVMFAQMSVRRQKDVNFDWDEVLNFEGETGPYLQYTHARLCSLMRNYDGEASPSFDAGLLVGEEETRVIELLADLPAAIDDAARNYDPFYVAQHLIRLAGAFNKFYQRKTETGRIDKIISEDSALTEARIALVKAVQVVLNEGLRLLGIKAPEEM